MSGGAPENALPNFHRTGGEDEAPKATDARRGWREILLAATLQGAIFALVKATVDRSAADQHVSVNLHHVTPVKR